MLDTNTKRRIDTARDILVGKVPDPKSQVEQITIALIYKFMDDMDAESEELGGKRTFFANGFSRYSWAKLMRSGLGGHETLNLYAEAITRMPENPAIPVLFRSIFKNAYLPYRDPETLKSFLKVIDEFEYDHSERLGDAFEYLLSVLGSQGDAGQFRTPRHIIDFMVKIIDPKKHEKILDPACGTAGFLISSFKHIREANKETPLTPDEMGALAANIKGYDISPDMVRLSLVNMYLHGFNDPHIEEYDTLTLQDKWNEYADVILANPPFMSPKGGIKPHKRFSVQSKRSEVLFVDYMHEHLTPHGRAAIIVPEGIIFQSGTAYKQLRKMLVENSLVAVVSLPAGVFQPYSGVKTSILILDKSLAKQSQHIGFFKVENDGFSLGAQRKPIEKNDLPQVTEEVGLFLQALEKRNDVEELELSTGQVVLKEKVAESGEYTLSGERYRENNLRQAKFPHCKLSEIAEITAGNSAPQGKEYFREGNLPFVRTSDVGIVHLSASFSGSADKINKRAVDKLNLRLFPVDTILFPKSGASTFLNHRVILAEQAYVSSHLACIICDKNKALPRYIYWFLCQVDARQITPDQAYPSLRLTEIGNIDIPLPPLEVQKEIVAEIEGYQKVIDGARAVIDNYKPQIPIDPEWEMVELAKIIDELESGVSVNSTNRKIVDSEVGILKTSCVTNGLFDPNEHKTVLPEEHEKVRCPVRGNTIIISRMNTEALVGANAFIPESHPNLYLPDRLWQTVISRNDIDVRYLQILLSSKDFREKISALCGGTSGSMKNISKKQLLTLKVPLPPIETQQAIVVEIEAEQALVNANRELIERFEKKIHSAIARV